MQLLRMTSIRGGTCSHLLINMGATVPATTLPPAARLRLLRITTLSSSAALWAHEWSFATMGGCQLVTSRGLTDVESLC